MIKTFDEIKKGLEACCDYMSVCDEVCPYAHVGEYPKCKQTLIQDVFGYFQQLAAQIPKWVSVEKDKPSGVNVFYEEGECFYEPAEYIVKVKGASVATAAMFDGENFIPASYEGITGGREFADRVTYWMQLPEIPKEE